MIQYKKANSTLTRTGIKPGTLEMKVSHYENHNKPTNYRRQQMFRLNTLILSPKDLTMYRNSINTTIIIVILQPPTKLLFVLQS